MARARKSEKFTEAAENVQGNLQSLREDVTQLTQQLESLLKDAGSEALDDVMARLGKAKSTVDGMLAEAGEKGKDAVIAAREMTGSVVDDVEEVVREHPLATIAVALGIGFILSSALRR